LIAGSPILEGPTERKGPRKPRAVYFRYQRTTLRLKLHSSAEDDQYTDLRKNYIGAV
jgi:hypothetical protein